MRVSHQSISQIHYNERGSFIKYANILHLVMNVKIKKKKGGHLNLK